MCSDSYNRLTNQIFINYRINHVSIEMLYICLQIYTVHTSQRSYDLFGLMDRIKKEKSGKKDEKGFFYFHSRLCASDFR